MSMKYFSNLHAGWADLTIEDFKGRVSYIRDIAWDILRAYEEYLIFGHCIIPFDEEKDEFNIYVDDTSIIIIRFDENMQIFGIKEDPKTFIKNLALDIATNLAEWCKWNNVENESYDIVANRVRELESACIRLDLFHAKIINFKKRGE